MQPANWAIRYFSTQQEVNIMNFMLREICFIQISVPDLFIYWTNLVFHFVCTRNLKYVI